MSKKLKLIIKEMTKQKEIINQITHTKQHTNSLNKYTNTHTHFSFCK